MNTRRIFLKQALAAGIVAPAIGMSQSIFNQENTDSKLIENLTNEELLAEYKKWVDAYVVEVKKEKELQRELKPNEALVNLPDQMEKMMPYFQSRFNQPQFLEDFMSISKQLTTEIDGNF